MSQKLLSQQTGQLNRSDSEVNNTNALEIQDRVPYAIEDLENLKVLNDTGRLSYCVS